MFIFFSPMCLTKLSVFTLKKGNLILMFSFNSFKSEIIIYYSFNILSFTLIIYYKFYYIKYNILYFELIMITISYVNNIILITI